MPELAGFGGAKFGGAKFGGVAYPPAAWQLKGYSAESFPPTPTQLTLYPRSPKYVAPCSAEVSLISAVRYT